MNGSRFLDFWYGKKFLFVIFILVAYFIIRFFSTFEGFGLKIDYTIIYPLLIIIAMLGIFCTVFYFLLRSRGIRLSSITQGVQDKKEIAKSYGLKPKRADWGLMNESDFVLSAGETKIKFYPAVWHMNPDRRYSRWSIGRASVMITNKRVMVGPGPFSIYFPSKSKKDDKHYWFIDIVPRRRFFFLMKSATLYFHVPEKLAGIGRHLPTPSITKRKEQGYVVDGFDFYPENINEFIDVINQAQ